MTFKHLTTALAFFLASTTTTLPVSAETFLPSDRDLEVIRAALSERMLDPASTHVTEVVGAKEEVDGQTLSWICGKVRGKNTFGGYAQPTNFIGALLEPTEEKTVFMVIHIAGPSNEEQLKTVRMCLDKLE